MVDPITCPDCDEGKVTTMNCKSGNAAECCMSCEVTSECETCEGTGEIDNDLIK